MLRCSYLPTMRRPCPIASAPVLLWDHTPRFRGDQVFSGILERLHGPCVLPNKLGHAHMRGRDCSRPKGIQIHLCSESLVHTESRFEAIRWPLTVRDCSVPEVRAASADI